MCSYSNNTVNNDLAILEGARNKTLHVSQNVRKEVLFFFLLLALIWSLTASEGNIRLLRAFHILPHASSAGSLCDV